MNDRLDSARARPAAVFLVLLLGVDLLLIAADVLVHVVRRRQVPVWQVSWDGGYGEFLQYVKYVWVIALLVGVAALRRAWSVLIWVPLFAYLLVDDRYQLHERLGAHLAQVWGLPDTLGLRAVDLGELLVMAAVSLAGVLLLLVGMVASTSATRRALVDVLLLLGVMAFFAVVVDMAHILFLTSPAEPLVGVLEDGGEMLALTLVVAYLYSLGVGGRPTAAWDRLVRLLGRHSPGGHPPSPSGTR